MENLTMIDLEGEKYSVKPELYEQAKAKGLRTVFNFTDEKQQPILVPEDKLDAAFKKGLRPKDHKEIPFWQSVSRGFKEGFRTMPGFGEAFGNVETPETQLESAQAWSEDPVSYGVGRTVGSVVGPLSAAFAGGVALKGGRKVNQYIKPSLEAAKQGYKETMASPNIPDPLNVVKPTIGVLKGAGKAIYQVPETAREVSYLNKLDTMAKNKQSGAINPQNNSGQGIALEMIQPGQSLAKEAISSRAATVAPGQINSQQMNEVLALGSSRRQAARDFNPKYAAEQMAPELRKVVQNLMDSSGKYYSRLHEKAKQQYTPEMGMQIAPKLSAVLKEARDTKGANAVASTTIEAAQQILDSPTSLTVGVVPNKKWEEVDSKEQYNRLKSARNLLFKQLEPIKKTNDPTILRGPTAQALIKAHDAIDSVMKAIPPQAKADAMYAAGYEASQGLMDQLKYGKKKTTKVDVPTLKRLFGNNDKAYRVQENIETMRMFIDKFGKNIPKARREQMIATINKFDELRKVAVDRGIVQGFRQVQGPTSPVLERTESLRASKGVPYNTFTFPSGTLNQLDEFMKRNVKEYTGVSRVEDLSPAKQKAMTDSFIWTQENPNATFSQIDSVIKKNLKGAR
jgi:hypothetical protein